MEYEYDNEPDDDQLRHDDDYWDSDEDSDEDNSEEYEKLINIPYKMVEMIKKDDLEGLEDILQTPHQYPLTSDQIFKDFSSQIVNSNLYEIIALSKNGSQILKLIEEYDDGLILPEYISMDDYNYRDLYDYDTVYRFYILNGYYKRLESYNYDIAEILEMMKVEKMFIKRILKFEDTNFQEKGVEDLIGSYLNN